MACRYAGQAPAYVALAREAHRSLQANIGPQRAKHYLEFLASSLLIRLIDPMEIRLRRKKGFPKICLIDHGLRASWLQELVPLDPESLLKEPHLSDIAGHIAESALGVLFSTVSGLAIAHFPERNQDPEIDFVLTIGTKRVPVEVKYRRKIDPYSDTENLRAFIEKSSNNATFGVLVTQTDEAPVHDPRIIALPLSSVMLSR
jgi:predicted AAA+ superfamily ATPase